MKKKIILTGGHSGIGLELTKKLLAEEHQIGLILRNEKRKNDLSKIIEIKDIDFFYGDLSKQSEVINIANQIAGKWSAVDILYNNAGVLLDEIYLSEQGNEMHFEVNTIAPLLLAKTLWKNIGHNSELKIINTVTDFLYKQKKLVSKTLLQPTKNQKLFGAYLQSKLALALLMNDWAKNDHKLKVLNVTPGPNKTKMTSGSGMPMWLLPFRNLFFSKPTKGASFLYDAAFNEKFVNQTGVFIQKNKIYNFPFQLDYNTKSELLDRIKGL